MSSDFFSAYTGARQSSRLGWFWALGLVLAALAGTLLLCISSQGHPIVTPHGIRQVHPGMSVAEVTAFFGSAMGSETVNGKPCLHFGTPTTEVPSFTVYRVCFKEGRVANLSEQRYAVTVVSSDPSAEEPPASR